MIEAYYGLLNMIFSPILGLPMSISETIMALLITFIVTLMYKKFIDHAAMKDIKAKVKAMQHEVKELQKTNPEAANKKMSEVMTLTNQKMKLSMKPMLPTMIIIFALLPWMATVYTGPIVLLPFDLPYFGADFGWLAWYMIISIPASQLFRKIMGVEL
jgi:uncharacterized membrane protein (DUF106 family)